MISGYFGKLPARGDFVRARLPADFVETWDAWLGSGIAASRERMGGEFAAAWAEAPIWRFVLGAGVCGAKAVAGIWMPSVDRANRLFPLSVAAALDAGAWVDAASASAWFEAAEQAGLAAVTEGVDPEALLGLVDALPTLPLMQAAGGSGSVMWTEGGPRVMARSIAGGILPGAGRFAAMLDDRFDAGGTGV